MDKRLEANIKVKKNITDALFSLMKEKKISDITISEIVKKAKVARASYYRNFKSKESVLYDFVYRIHNEYVKKVKFDPYNVVSYSSVLNSFKYYLKYKKYIIAICSSNHSNMYLEMLNSFFTDVAGDMPSSSIDRYKLYFYSGALFNMSIKWIEEGTRETPEEMAEAFMKYCSVNKFDKE